MLAKLRLLLAAGAALVVLVLPSAAAAATPEYFPLPDNRRIGEGIVADPAGNVWFGAQMLGPESVPPLGRLVPAAASPGSSNGISLFPTPSVGESCCANFIRDVAYDALNGRVWFVRSTGAVGYGKVAEMVAGSGAGLNAVRVPGGGELGGIAVAANGRAWFTEWGATSSPNFYGNRVASTDDSLAISELPDLAHYTGTYQEIRYDAEPRGITIVGGTTPWFTEQDTGNPGYRLAKVVGAGYEEHLLQPCQALPPCSGSYSGTGPVSVAAALDGTIWFTNVLKNTFGRFDPATETMTQYALTSVDPQLAGGEPRSIRLAADGSLWLAESGYIAHPSANALVRIAPTDPPTATVYRLGAGKAPFALAPDSRGNVWFTASGDSAPDFVGLLAGVVGPPPSPTSTPKSELVPPPGEVTVPPAGVGVAKAGEVLVHGTDVWANQVCVGPPQDRCSLVYLLDAHEYVNGFPGTKPRLAAASAKRKTRRVVVGRKAVTIAGGKTATVKIKLNAKGKKILERDGVLRLTFHATQKLAKGKKKAIKTKKLTIRAPG